MLSDGPQATRGRLKRAPEIDLKKPLRLRFVDSGRDREAEGLRVVESALNTPVSGREEEKSSLLAATSAVPLRSQGALRSHGLPFACGVSAAILFWLYALPVLRPNMQVPEPGAIDLGGGDQGKSLIADSGSDLASAVLLRQIDRDALHGKASKANAEVSVQIEAERSPRVAALAQNPMHGTNGLLVMSKDQVGDSGDAIASGSLATQLSSLNPETRQRAAERLLERGWREEHLDLAREFLRSPLSMQKEIVSSLATREDLNVVPWFLWMLEVAEADLASTLIANLESAATPRDAAAIRAASETNAVRFCEPLQRLASALDQRGF
ncbi:MAG: hypothetical protein ACE361_02390 [Aureliella sp.]